MASLPRKHLPRYFMFFYLFCYFFLFILDHKISKEAKNWPLQHFVLPEERPELPAADGWAGQSDLHRARSTRRSGWRKDSRYLEFNRDKVRNDMKVGFKYDETQYGARKSWRGKTVTPTPNIKILMCNLQLNQNCFTFCILLFLQLNMFTICLIYLLQ